MKVLIVGYGSIGQRHGRNLRAHYPQYEVMVYRHGAVNDVESSNVKHDGALLGNELRHTNSLADVKNWCPDAVMICNPASHHIETAKYWCDLNVPLFVEKPLSHDLASLTSLRKAMPLEVKNVPVMVGFDLRYHPVYLVAEQCITAGKLGPLFSVMADVGQYLPDWRPAMDYRQSVSARRELGGGVLLELCHEINYLQGILGFKQLEVFGLLGRYSPLDIDVEDVADISLRGINRYGQNMSVALHLDFLQRVPRRQCVIVGGEGTLHLDFIEKKVLLKTPGAVEVLYSQQDYDTNKLYLKELELFFAMVESGTLPPTDFDDAFQTQLIIDAVQRSAERKCLLSVNLDVN